jgi:hypothetical protein
VRRNRRRRVDEALGFIPASSRAFKKVDSASQMEQHRYAA